MLRPGSDYFAHSDTGRARRANEDAYFARSPVFVVADGMGGAQAGEVASRVAVEAFERGIGDPDASTSAEQLLADRVLEANARIHEMSQRTRTAPGWARRSRRRSSATTTSPSRTSATRAPTACAARTSSA